MSYLTVRRFHHDVKREVEFKTSYPSIEVTMNDFTKDIRKEGYVILQDGGSLSARAISLSRGEAQYVRDSLTDLLSEFIEED